MVQDTVPVAEAAARLGLSEHAVRKRIQRGMLPAVKDGAGRWLVVLDPLDTSSSTPETPSKTTGTPVEDTSHVPQDGGAESVYRELVDTLRAEADFLRGELTARTEELRRKDHIIAGLTSRIPELPAGQDAPQASPAAPGAAEPAGHGAEALPWWRRVWWLRDRDRD